MKLHNGLINEDDVRESIGGSVGPSNTSLDGGDRVLPATPENMVCTRGCRHYTDMLVESPDANEVGEGKALYRFCRAVMLEGETLELTDSAVFACSGFSPRSPLALGAWLANRRKIRKARAAIAQKGIEAQQEAQKLERPLAEQGEEL